MKRRVEPYNGSKSDSDRAKRIYRSALESIKLLEPINKADKAYRVVFGQEAVALRNKLKNYCEKLMFYNPVEYGRKAEEVLWRKVFYDVIQVVKKNKDHVRRHGSVETAYRTHLASAVGYYQHLVFRLQRDFSLKLAGVIDYYLLQEQRPGRRSDLGKSVPPSVQEWAQRACHRCLICLGDILRYLCDVDHMAITTTAERYYHQAFILFPEIGMPHNQLGTLAGSRYCGCEAAYHYIRCLACEKPFEGARGNLSRLFEKNAKRFDDLNKELARDLPPEQQRCQDVKRFLTRYLKLLEIFLGNNVSMELTEMQGLCQHTLQDFNLCMFYEDDALSQDLDGVWGGDPGDPLACLYLDDGIVFKIVCCLICTIHLLERTGSAYVTAATAFLLALFSHILNHVVARLQAKLEELEHPNKILLAGDALHKESLHVESSGSEEEIVKKPPPPVDNNGSTSPRHTTTAHTDTKKSRPSRLRNLRRRRKRRQLSDSSDDAMSDMSDLSDLSEGRVDDLEELQVLSSESEDEDLANYFYRASDSDLSDEECSQPYVEKSLPPKHDGRWPAQGQGLPNGDFQHIWSNGVDNNGLAHMSSELFSSSLMFLGQDLAHNADMSQPAGEDVSVPPGFLSSIEAKHVAEITEKLANFDIETDTETSFFPTDTEHSGNLTETDEADNEQSSSSNTDNRQDACRVKLQQTLEVVQAEGLLATVKVMCDWMRGQVAILSVCARSSHSLWQRLSVLLNFLPHENDLSHHDVCWLQELQLITTQIRFSDWAQGFPLTEDIEMCQLPTLGDIHGQIDFTIRHRAQLTDMQETFLRICCLRRFGYFLSSIDSIEFCYKPETAMFIGPSTDANTAVSSQDSMEKMKDTESRRNQLMKDMAQLRLQAEVKELEGSLRNTDQPTFPPYVLVDDSALCAHLPIVKELAASARCIVVIPIAVVDSLDMKKKDNTRAREVIRWLEVQLRRGNRYIRAQKTQESLLPHQHGSLKKKNRDSWYMMELLGCARYLAQQTGTFTGHSKVVVMTGDARMMEKVPTTQQLKAVAAQEGVSVETVPEFRQRWRSFLQQSPPAAVPDLAVPETG